MFRTKSRIEIAGRLNRVAFVAADAVFIVAVLNMYPNTQIENRKMRPYDVFSPAGGLKKRHSESGMTFLKV
jgi:hypothetical protein